MIPPFFIRKEKNGREDWGIKGMRMEKEKEKRKKSSQG